jgi:hypothetical protein
MSYSLQETHETTEFELPRIEMDQAQKILKLEAELKEKATSQARSDTEIQKLTKDLAQKTVEDAKSKSQGSGSAK